MVSQKKKILYDLKRGRKIDVLDAIKQYGCLRLSGRIFELRKEGYEKIKTDMNKGYATYFLPE